MIWGEHAEKYPELLKEEAKCLLFTLGNQYVEGGCRM